MIENRFYTVHKVNAMLGLMMAVQKVMRCILLLKTTGAYWIHTFYKTVSKSMLTHVNKT